MAARRYNAVAYQPDEDLMSDTMFDLSDAHVLIEAVEVEMEGPALDLAPALASTPALAPAEEQPIAASVNPALTVVSSAGVGDN
ncbi:hypothetical protein BGZ88_002589 [Linnemannia elongata]|nr:hypothetical protein BGZ88_002589 [Linnemannia elongata]